MSDIDALAEVFEFRRTTAPPEYREQVETEGYDLIVYYVRTESSSSNSESLSLVQMADKRSLRMDLFAFVAFGEPDASRGFREALSKLLCDEGYLIDGKADCSASHNSDSQ